MSLLVFEEKNQERNTDHLSGSQKDEKVHRYSPYFLYSESVHHT